MENQSVSKYTVSFGFSLALCSVLNALLVVAKEKCHAVAAAMQRVTGHHWITHGAAVMLLFLVCGWLFARPNGGQGLQPTASRLLGIIVAGVLAGGGIIMGFYLIAD
jgi:hypothetical protein